MAASLTVTVTGTKPYAMDNCWLTLEHGVIYWAFVAPVALVILVSIYRYHASLPRRRSYGFVTQSFLPHVGEEWLRDESVRTSAWEANITLDCSVVDRCTGIAEIVGSNSSLNRALFLQLVLFKLCTKQRWLSCLDYFSLLSRSTLFCLFSCCVA